MSTLLEKIEEIKKICGIVEEDTELLTEGDNAMEQHINRGLENQTEMTETTESVVTVVKKQQQFKSINIVDQPKNLTGGTLKYYQMDSLIWLMNIHRMSMLYNYYFREYNVKQPYNYYINPILADYMGLGKTIYTLALLCQVYESFGIRGKHLIIVPKSTLPQWYYEQYKWCPMFRLITIIGEKEERDRHLQLLYSNRYDIVLTTYDIIRIEQSQFLKHEWAYAVFDEGHKLKDAESLISYAIRYLKADHKILLTGTPIQNDLHELWSLLNILMPYVFNNPEEFMAIVNASKDDKQDISQIQRILKMIMLRREKEQVERLPPKTEYLIKCPMTTLQKKLYRGILTKDLDSLYAAIKSKSADLGKTSLLNILMQLRKTADHPYLFKGVEPEPFRDGDHLINSAGKMVVLHALLQKIIQRGEKVLIFCYMTAMLNLVADYLQYKQVPFCRIDGSTELDERSASMKHFMKEDSPIVVFLLSTRAGCLGLNLTAANHVIVYQQDFNPQVDQQAVARSYRILQKKPCYVYRLLSENSVDEKIYERACVKMELDYLIIQSGNFSGKQVDRDLTKTIYKGGLLDLIAFKTDELFKEIKVGEKDSEIPDYDYGPEVEFPEEKVDKLLNEAAEFYRQYYEKAEQEKKKAESVLYKLQTDGKLDGFDTRELYQFEGEQFGRDSLKRLAYEMAEKRVSAAAQRFRMVVEEEEKDKRWYPTQQRFKKSSLYRPDYYLLADEFYKLYDKVIKEISRYIEPIFSKDSKITYEEYCQTIKQSSPYLYSEKYSNENLPGLSEEEIATYNRYLEVGCPYISNKEITKRDFNNVLTSICEYDPSQHPELLGVRKIQQTDLAEQKQVESPVLGVNLFPYEMLSTKLNTIFMAKQLDTSGAENLDIAYQFYQKSNPKSNIQEEEFLNYAQALIMNIDRLDDGMKIRQRMQKSQSKRQQYMLRCYALRLYIEKFENPLIEMKIPVFYQQRKTYSTLEDRYLLYLTDCFGYGRWSEILTFIRVSPVFVFDWWFKSRDEEEICSRVDKLIKVIAKYEGINDVF